MFGSYCVKRFIVHILLERPLHKNIYNELAPSVFLLKLLHFEAYFNKEV